MTHETSARKRLLLTAIGMPQREEQDVRAPYVAPAFPSACPSPAPCLFSLSRVIRRCSRLCSDAVIAHQQIPHEQEASCAEKKRAVENGPSEKKKKKNAFSWVLFSKQINVIMQENERFVLTEYG